MKRWTVFFLAVVVTSALLLPSAHAEPKKKLYNNSSEQVFKAALRTARERHVVTYVDEKNKYGDAAKKFADVAARYPRTRPGQMARYYAALSLEQVDRNDEAEKDLVAVESGGDEGLIL